jgi:hypothetical protein
MLKTPARAVLPLFGSSTFHLGKRLFLQAVGGGEMAYASDLRTRALTNTRPSANVALILLRVADLAAA